METITTAIKETAKEMMSNGINGYEVAKAIASKFGNATARLIMISIALDMGKENEVKQYLAQL